MPNKKLYRAVINMPRIEYSHQSSDFSIIKVLNLAEIKQLTSSLFHDWHLKVL